MRIPDGSSGRGEESAPSWRRAEDQGEAARFRRVLVLLGLAGVALILIATARYGAGVSPDSGAYLSAGRSFAAGSGLRLIDETPLLRWPPLYPWLLGVMEMAWGVHPLRAAAAINALLFGLNIWLGGLLMARHLTRSRLVLVAGAFFLLFSSPLYRASVMVWTEPLFIFLALAFILRLEDHLKRGNLVSLGLLAGLAGLACLTRYIGVTLIASGVVTILLLGTASPKRRRVHAALFALASIAPLVLWLMRNHAVSGTLTGPRGASGATILHSAYFTFQALFSCFLPESVTGQPVIVVGLTVLTLGLAGVGWRWIWRAFRPAWPRIGPLALFAAMYLAILMVTSMITSYDRIDQRLLSPIYVPLILIGLLIVDGLVASLRGRFSAQVVSIFLGVVFVACLIFPCQDVIGGTMWRAREGAGGYNTRYYREHEILRFMQEQPLERGWPVYSNAPEALYILTELPVKLSPRKPRSAGRGGRAASLDGTWPGTSPAYLVWFGTGGRSVYSIVELERLADLSPLSRFTEGAIYTVVRKAPR